MKRRISTLTLVHAAHAKLLLSDLTRIVGGQDPLGPDQATPPESAYRRAARDATKADPSNPEENERDALDDALDDELAKMD